MNDDFFLKKYLAEKKILKYNLKGYDLDQIMALDLISEVYNIDSFKLKTLRFCFLSYKLDALSNANPNLKLFSIGKYPRKDYYEILNYVSSQVSDFFLLDFNKIKLKISINSFNLFFAFKHVFKNSTLSFKSKLFLSSQLSFYLNIITELEKINPVYSKYCAFSSVHQLEAILTCFFKKKKTLTYSLQHGVYYVFKKNIPLDLIAYENFISDNHFCWGQYSKDEFIKYGIAEDSLLIGGYPRHYTVKAIPSILDGKNCVVLLARYSLEKTNMKLLELLKRFSKEKNIKISLKLHPSLKHSDYMKICESQNWELVDELFTISDLFTKCDFGFSIAVNTAAYYESYMNYVPSLRFNDETFEDALGVNNDTFNTHENLKLAYNNIPFDNEMKLKEYFETSNIKLKYIMGLGINKYSILNS